MFLGKFSRDKRLSEIFDKITYKRVDLLIISSISNGLVMYEVYGCQDKLKDFAQKYFQMKRVVESKRSMYADHMQSTEYKEDRLINKILIRKKFRDWNKFCADLNKFEEEYFNRTNITLLQIENERYNEEQENKRNQTI